MPVASNVVRESMTAVCPNDCEVSFSITTRAAVVPARLESPPVDQEARPAVTPEEAIDEYPECPGCDAEMEVEWDG